MSGGGADQQQCKSIFIMFASSSIFIMFASVGLVIPRCAGLGGCEREPGPKRTYCFQAVCSRVAALEKRNPRQHWVWGGRGAGRGSLEVEGSPGDLHVSSLPESEADSCDGHHSFTFLP
jgi:hypothetical protein